MQGTRPRCPERARQRRGGRAHQRSPGRERGWPERARGPPPSRVARWRSRPAEADGRPGAGPIRLARLRLPASWGRANQW